jgi:hypothetical protein
VPAKDEAAVTKTAQTPKVGAISKQKLTEWRKEGTTVTFKTICESPWRFPVSPADVCAVGAVDWTTTAAEDNSGNDEHDNDQQLPTGAPELLFRKTKRTEQLHQVVMSATVASVASCMPSRWRK